MRLPRLFWWHYKNAWPVDHRLKAVSLAGEKGRRKSTKIIGRLYWLSSKTITHTKIRAASDDN